MEIKQHGVRINDIHIYSAWTLRVRSVYSKMIH